MKLLDRGALLILILAGLNYLSTAFFQTDIIATIFGGPESIGYKIVAVLIVICALWCIKYFSYAPQGYRRNRR